MEKPFSWYTFNFKMMTNDLLEGIVRVDDEACPHPGEEWRLGEHGAALGGPGRHVPGVATLSDHQDKLVTPANREHVFLSRKMRDRGFLRIF